MGQISLKVVSPYITHLLRGPHLPADQQKGLQPNTPNQNQHNPDHITLPQMVVRAA